MKALSKRNLSIALVFLLIAFLLREVSGFPSGGSYPPTFTQRVAGGDWYDSWGFDRNYYDGASGYMPNIAYETLGNSKELAYSIGESFKTSYTSKVQRAVEILKYVQRWTEYGYDVNSAAVRAVTNGVPQNEWAWNADEMAHMFDTTTGTVAVGDCEDMAFLCAAIYTAAGFDVAMVLAISHVALLIWLPEYPNANYYWDIGDGRGRGWIWVEATGEHNPLGWTPPVFNDHNWTTYPLGLMISNVNRTPQKPQAEDNVTVTASVVSAKASVSQVLLNYAIRGTAYNTTVMTLRGAMHETFIPKQPKGTTIEFYISATDSEGNTKETESFSYTVGMEFEIPGLTWESIIIGLIIGIALLVFFMKRKTAPPTPNVSTSPSS